MAEEQYSGEKTEPATPRKRRESREKGNVPRSQDLNTAVLLLTGFLLLFFLTGHLLEGTTGLESRIFSDVAHARLTIGNVAAMGSQGLLYLLTLMMPMALVLFVVAVAINIVQVGFLVTFQPLAPQLNRVNPLKGFSRIFSRRGLMRLVFGIFKLIVVSTVLVLSCRSLVAQDDPKNFLQLLVLEPIRAAQFASGALFQLGSRAATALLILAIFDFAFQRWQHERDLMMTKQELREELKRMEGDPKLKERRRKIQQRLALQRMMFEVPKANVVITNPVHVACALQYQEQDMTAPKLLAKGQGYVAHRIREVAVEHGVAVVERPALARLIFDTTEIGEEIPAELYQPVAEVLAYVYRLGQRVPVAG